jgi:hypothetical protein
MSNRQLSALEDWNSVEQSGNSYKFGKWLPCIAQLFELFGGLV